MFHPITSPPPAQESIGLAIAILSLIIASYASYTDEAWRHLHPDRVVQSSRQKGCSARRLQQLVINLAQAIATPFGIQVMETTEIERYQTRLQEALSAQSTLAVAAQAQQQALDEAKSKLQALQAQLIQTEKLSGLGQMMVEVAHDINNPIGFIHGNLVFVEQYVHSLTALIDVYHQYCPQQCAPIQAKIDEIGLSFIRKDFPKVLASMQDGVDRIQEMVQSLTRYSRIDQATPTLAHLDSSINATLRMLRPRLNKSAPSHSITLTHDCGALPPIYCFPGQINQVIMNVVSNAIDALETTLEPAPTIHIQTRQLNATWVRVSISDNGPGMSPETQARLYDPFFTTKPAGQGTGLGLAISRQIVVERHRGRLCSHSGPEGTTFDIDLPIHPATISAA
ncbi:MAG: sensor histidine kinase [Elainellaceae cyanobacterium]